MTAVLITRFSGQRRLTWNGADLRVAGTARQTCIAALPVADNHDPRRLSPLRDRVAYHAVWRALGVNEVPDAVSVFTFIFSALDTSIGI